MDKKKTTAADRPENKMMVLGTSALSDAELLEVLIGKRVPTPTDTAIGRVLLAECDGIYGLAKIAPYELMQLDSRILKPESCRICAAVELGKRVASMPRYERVRADSPQDVANIVMEDMRHLDQECLRVMILNSKNDIIGIREISVGTVNSSYINPSDVFRVAIKMAAARIILIHNHPSGDSEPSDTDIVITQMMERAGELLGIPVTDHLIIGDGTFVSMRRRNLMGDTPKISFSQSMAA